MSVNKYTSAFLAYMSDLFGTAAAGEAQSKRMLVGASIGSLTLKVFATLIAFITSVALARWLGAAEYGAYSYSLAWIQVLVVPTLLGMDKLAVRQASLYRSTRSWSNFKGFTRTTTRWVLSMSVMVILGAVVTVYVISGEEGNPYRAPMTIGLLLIPVIVISRLRQAILIGLDRVVIGQLPESVVVRIIFLILIGIFWLFSIQESTASTAIAANLAASIIGLIVGLSLLRTITGKDVRNVAPSMSDKPLWLKAIIPMTSLGVLQILNMRMDILFLGFFEPPDFVGIYNVAISIGTLIGFFAIAANAAISATVASAYSRQDKIEMQSIARKTSRIIFLLSLPFSLVFLFFGSICLSIFGPEYRSGAVVLGIVAIGQLVNALMGTAGMFLTMTGHEREAAYGAAMIVIVGLFLNYYLIREFGIIGAASAFTIAAFLWGAFCTVAVYRLVGILPFAFGGYPIHERPNNHV